MMDTMPPLGTTVPSTSMSSRATRSVDRATGPSKRRNSSMAEGSRSGLARNSANWSGCRMSASTPLETRLTVGSCPVFSRNITSATSSCSVSRSPASRAAISADSRSGSGAPGPAARNAASFTAIRSVKNLRMWP